jgi:hypothetical protein
MCSIVYADGGADTEGLIGRAGPGRPPGFRANPSASCSGQ